MYVPTKGKKISGAVFGAGVALLFLSASVASAGVVGELQGSSGTGLVTVTISQILWGTDTTSSTGTGNAEVATGTTLTFSGGSLALGESIFLQNLTLGITNVPNFITFPTPDTNLIFNITGEGPGSAQSNCALATATGESCSVGGASNPLVLTWTPSGTSVSVSLNGTAVDGSGQISDWTGTFSTPFNAAPSGEPDAHPAEIADYFAKNPGGSLSHVAGLDITANTIPEPATVVLVGCALVAAGFIRRRARQ